MKYFSLNSEFWSNLANTSPAYWSKRVFSSTFVDFLRTLGSRCCRRGTTFFDKVGSFKQGRVWIKILPSPWPATHYITLTNVKTRSGPDRKTVYVIPRLLFQQTLKVNFDTTKSILIVKWVDAVPAYDVELILTRFDSIRAPCLLNSR